MTKTSRDTLPTAARLRESQFPTPFFSVRKGLSPPASFLALPRGGPELPCVGTGLYSRVLPAGVKKNRVLSSSHRRRRGSGAESIRSRSGDREGCLWSPALRPPAGAFLSGQAVFHGRELLQSSHSVSDLPFSPGLALGGAGCTGPAGPLAWISAPSGAPRRPRRAGRRRDVLFFRRLSSPRPVGRVLEW